jgi:hypothetical protein
MEHHGSPFVSMVILADARWEIRDLGVERRPWNLAWEFQVFWGLAHRRGCGERQKANDSKQTSFHVFSFGFRAARLCDDRQPDAAGGPAAREKQ